MNTSADRPQRPALSVLFSLAVAFPAMLAAQEPTSVVGVVLDETTLAPVADAAVTLPDLGISARTDGAGNFVLQGMPAGRSTVRVTRSGFSTAVDNIDVTEGEVGYVQIFLLPVATVLNEVLVIARAGSQGSVVEGGAERVSAMTAADLLAREIPGLMTGRSGGVGGGTRLIIRGVKSFTGNNLPAIYLDGVRISRGVSSVPFNEAPRLPILDELPASHVKRIRVLKGPSAAAQFGDSANGVILIETYRGDQE